MKTSRAKNLEVRTGQTNARSSTRNGARSLSASAFSASALLATAMILLALAPFGNAANAETISSRQWHAQWATISSSLASTLGASDEKAARVQSEQLWRWMQHRAATLAPSQNLTPRTLIAQTLTLQNLTPQQIGALLDEWHATQRGQISQNSARHVTNHATQSESSTRFHAHAFDIVASPPRQISPLLSVKSRKLSAFSLTSHAAAMLCGVRTNHFDE